MRTVMAICLCSTLLSSPAFALAIAGGNGNGNGRKAPLAELPSAPGAHVSRIKALGDNQWLQLGKPQPDPKYGSAPGRSYTNKMACAPGLGGAFLMGEGVHGKAMTRGGKLHYNDDVWFYDLRAHRWICVHPGTDVGSFECRLDENGFEVDVKTGQHLPIAFAVHGYECYEYLPDVKKFMTLETGSPYWKKHLGSRRSKWASGISKGAARARKKCPFLYDIETGRWERRKVQSGPRPHFCRSLIHLPELKKVAFYSRKADFWFYDYVANNWSHVTGRGPAPSGGDYEGASCYDSKRRRIYAFNRNKKNPGKFGIYDVQTNTWLVSKSEVQPDVVAGSGYSSTRTAAHYDSVNDVVFLRLRGRNAKNPGVFIYDPEKDEWTPKPINSTSGGSNSFYDPELNVHVFFDARDSRLTPGEINVYRYKRR